MNWSNLKKNTCPKCDYKLEIKSEFSWLICPNPDCDFKCRQQKAREIIGNIKSPRLSLAGRDKRTDEVEENLGLLNSL